MILFFIPLVTCFIISGFFFLLVNFSLRFTVPFFTSLDCVHSFLISLTTDLAVGCAAKIADEHESPFHKLHTATWAFHVINV